MTSFFSFMRSDLFLSLAGGFALGIAGIALVKPASATSDHTESKAVRVEVPVNAVQPIVSRVR
jgi:hypothetical protein